MVKLPGTPTRTLRSVTILKCTDLLPVSGEKVSPSANWLMFSSRSNPLPAARSGMPVVRTDQPT